ncbi:MAG: pyridoxal phosphate-dependent aminotransferase [Planctomycetes bacterium]|nr:pyridoxal phosphate-dependent aminotransferase [Planctomycetota bacterium]
MKISQRAQSVPPSMTIAVTARAKELKAEGVDIVGFGAGEPDFDTPQYIKDAAIEAIQAGQTKYTAVAGIPELRKAIVDKLKLDNGLDYSPDQVIVNVGGKHSVYEAMQAILDPGDEVIIPTPYWVTYPETVTLAGGVTKIVETDRSKGYCLTPELLKAAMTERTVMLVLNSPSNPGGFTYSPAQLAALAKVLEGTDIYVMSDEMYEKLIYGDTQFISFAALSEDAYQRTLTLNGLSKAFSMTGWRLGFAAGPLDVIKAMGCIQSHMTSNAVTFVQYAAVVALGPESKDAIETMRAEFEKRAKVMADRLNSIDGVRCAQPTGAFYCFPDVSAHFGRTIGDAQIQGSLDFAQALLEQRKVAVVPGVAFGCDDNVRLSFACSLEQITKGLDRLEAWLSQ